MTFTMHYVKNVDYIRSMQIVCEKETLMDLVDSVDFMGKVACYILLDNREQAEHYIKKLSKKEVVFFKSLPIYNLYNSKNHSDV